VPVDLLTNTSVRIDRNDYVYDVLRGAIVNGLLVPGERLYPGEIAQQLQVSRTPVREALLRLAAVNLVVELPNGGLAVVSHREDEVHALFAAREALEGMAARLSAERITDGQLARMGELVAVELEGGKVEPPQAQEAYFLPFHELIHTSCGNHIIASLLTNVNDALKVHQNSRMPGRTNVRQVTDEHRRIFECLRARDADGAEQAMRDHQRSMMKIWL
jgi:DNA-binding GntR family transcriptional regulator